MTDDSTAERPGESADASGAVAESSPDEVDADDQAPQRGRRDVVVPMELYKVVTVFSTLIATVAVVAGFVVLDAATNRGRAPASEVDVVLAVLGVGIIAFGGAVYAFSTRFRAQGMGKSKDEANGDADNG